MRSRARDLDALKRRAGRRVLALLDEIVDELCDARILALLDEFRAQAPDGDRRHARRPEQLAARRRRRPRG